MLKKLYVNNYRCFVNFELNMGNLALLLGSNGGGKSTLFDILRSIRTLLVDRARTQDVFPVEDITVWSKQEKQTFELTVGNGADEYVYKLVLAPSIGTNGRQIESEEVLFNTSPLFVFRQGEVQLFDDVLRPGPRYPFDPTVSALATITPRPDNTRLTWFGQWIEKLLVISLQPRMMFSVTGEESAWLNHDATNFASWYRYLSQEYQDKMFALTEKLRAVLPGFHSFRLEQAGRQRILKVGFTGKAHQSSLVFFDFSRLSDGQRVLIVLYSMLVALDSLGYSVFLDEPENYVSLSEIQPWLMELRDACDEGPGQAVIISHHPELIDYLGSECGQWIDRGPLEPARVRAMPAVERHDLKLSEQVARGWVHE